MLLVASRRSDAFFFHLPLGRLGSPPPNFACFFLSEGNFNEKGGKRKSIRIRKGERRNFFLPNFFSRIPLFHHAILESVHASGNASRRNTRKLSVVLDRFRHYSAAHRHIVSSRRGKIIGSDRASGTIGYIGNFFEDKKRERGKLLLLLLLLFVVGVKGWRKSGN